MDGKCGIIMCNLNGGMDKGGHYDVEMKGGCKRGALSCVNYKGGWIRMGTMIWKSKGECKKVA